MTHDTHDFPFWISGQPKSSGRRLEIRSPYDASPVGVTYEATADDLEAAIDAASRAFSSCARLSTFQRAEILARLIERVRTEQGTLARLIALEAGKPIKLARAETNRALGTLTDALEETKRIRGEWLPLDLDAGSAGRQAIVRRFPRGPVAAITPYNFPLNLVVHKLAPVLACGSTVVIKPAPQAPLSALFLTQLAVEAGALPGSVNTLLCPVAIAQALVTDDRLKVLSFTGSAAAGWALKAKAGRKHTLLELGGNAGVIIHSDADLDLAAARCAAGGFSYAGQSCISVQRILVQRSVFDSFTQKLLAAVAKLHVGDPLDEATDVGPLISTADAERVEGRLRAAVAGGARLLCGGDRDRALLSPAVLTATKPDMAVWCEEIFAPVVAVEAYADLPEAYARINDSRYGLQAGLFTRDLDAAFAAFQQLEVGALLLNDVPTYRADVMPYGGVKDSGIGREGVRYAIEELTDRRTLILTSPNQAAS